MQEAERLKMENEELRKLGEDAVLDQQLSKALQETDKLKLAADAYKKELLQQKVTELQSELAQTSKRLKVAEEENIGEAATPVYSTGIKSQGQGESQELNNRTILSTGQVFRCPSAKFVIRFSTL